MRVFMDHFSRSEAHHFAVRDSASDTYAAGKAGPFRSLHRDAPRRVTRGPRMDPNKEMSCDDADILTDARPLLTGGGKGLAQKRWCWLDSRLLDRVAGGSQRSNERGLWLCVAILRRHQGDDPAVFHTNIIQSDVV